MKCMPLSWLLILTPVRPVRHRSLRMRAVPAFCLEAFVRMIFTSENGWGPAGDAAHPASLVV
eukprot:7404845-Pyramimonas_sp.AAC.1